MKKLALLLPIFFLIFSTNIRSQVIIQYTVSGECSPVIVDLLNGSDISITGTPVWTWDINGDIYNDFELPGQIFEAGFYNVTLSLEDDLGIRGSDFISFQIYPGVNSFFISSGGEACPGEQLQFWFDDQTRPFYVEWAFGDNSVRESQHSFNYPTHTYYEAGTYDVTLIIDHYCGYDTIVQQVTIGAGAKPSVNAYISNGEEFCPSDPVVFDVEGEYNSYLWDFGDGTQSTKRRATHVYPTDIAVNYSATVKVTNSCGNTATDTVLVTFVDDLPADAGFDYYFESQGLNPCPGTPVEFNAWGAGIYEWDFGDGSISNEQKAVNYFTQPGKYSITLRVWNGCGKMDMRTDSIEVVLDPEDTPYADFWMEVAGLGDSEDWSDTITVCPGMLINFRNGSYSFSDADMNHEWDFGDGVKSFSKNASHVYNTPSAIPYAVTLNTSNSCGGSDRLTKYVLVDNGLLPEVSPGVLPLVICDGEEVFFYLNEGLDDGNYVFDIDFGDGQTLNNATTYSDSILETIANHTYNGAPGTTFDFTFSTTNECGNTSDFMGTIRITDDPQLKPAYYVDNTTTMSEGPMMADWSRRRSPDDHEFVINFTWPDWPGGQDNFVAYFWYGGFYPGDQMDPPNGFVEYRTSDVQVGDSIKAYVPIDPSYPPEVGFAVGWSCSGEYSFETEPEVWNMQLDFLGIPQQAFPLMPAGYTNMNTVGNPIILDMGSWDGKCNSEKPPENTFYQLNAGQYIQLTLDREFNEYYLEATKDERGFDYITDISYGDYMLIGQDSIEFMGWGPCSDIPGMYRYSIAGDTISFVNISDFCPERVEYMTKSSFRKHPDFGSNMIDLAACPQDNVQFSVAGGVSYEWHFGDGSPVSNERYPMHKYASAGKYEAFVVASNACGRTDTVHTPVRISEDNPPYAGFWWEDGEFSRLEPIQFEYEEYFDRAGNFTYLWDFGDGKTSTLASPVHTYQRSGNYTISLTVSNGCGSSTQTQMIWIKDAILNCEAKIRIDSIIDNTVHFTDISRGKITDWFWEFGDGFTSGMQNPVHTYNNNGIFWVCLSVYDSIDDCSHQVCRQVQVGTQQCIADFTSKVNTTTSRVQFTDLSTNATEWFWDFGDGSFSDLQNPVHTYNEPGWYYVCLSVYNEVLDCFAYRCMELQVGLEDTRFCFADFSYFVDEETNTVKFTDESSENITNLYWTFGDGTFLEERNPVKTYKGPGMYPVCLIVYDETTGCTDEICYEVPVGISECNLNADFAFFIDINSDAVTFSNRSGGTSSGYFWDFGDGVTSSAKNPKHQYEQPGFYLVTLSIWDKETGCNDHTADFIQIGTVDCRAAFEYKVDAATRNVQFYNQSQGTLAAYFWDFDDGTFSEEKDPQHQFKKAGLYFVSLTVINDVGLCMDFIFEPIQVGTIECAARFKYFIDSSTNVAYFTPEAIGTTTDYLWFFGDGSISTNKEARHQFTQPGYFTVGLNTYNDETGCMDYWEEVILIGRAGSDCRAGFSYVSDPAAKQVKFGDRSKGKIVEYIWDFGDGNYSTERNPVHPYAIGGYYLVCLTVVNNFGIPNTFCDFIQMATSDQERCFAEFYYTVDSTTKTVEFVQHSHGDPDGFMWYFGDGATSTNENPSHTYTEAGYYLVELSIANSASNCTSNGFDLINVAEGNKGLRAAFSYRADSSNLKADTYPVDFVGVSLGDAGKLKWDFGDGTTDTTTMNPTHNYTSPGVYTACLTISNPITGDESTTCQEVKTAGYTGIDPNETWNSGLANYPNPFDRTTYIVYDLKEGTSVDLVLFDQTGRLVDIILKEDQIAGSYRMEYDGSRLDSGIYTLRLATDKGVYTARMVIK